MTSDQAANMRLLTLCPLVLLLVCLCHQVEAGRKRRVKATVPTQIEPPPDTTQV